MNLRAWARRLREAADAIDAIFEQPGTPDIAEAIRHQVVNRPRRVTITRDMIKRVRDERKPKFKYHGKHWTQRPENRARMVAMLKRNAKNREKAS
jgi:hypothetical protein